MEVKSFTKLRALSKLLGVTTQEDVILLQFIHLLQTVLLYPPLSGEILSINCTRCNMRSGKCISKHFYSRIQVFICEHNYLLRFSCNAVRPVIELSREQRAITDQVMIILRAKHVENCIDLNLEDIFMCDKMTGSTVSKFILFTHLYHVSYRRIASVMACSSVVA
jgi:hypothetical protein